MTFQEFCDDLQAADPKRELAINTVTNEIGWINGQPFQTAYLSPHALVCMPWTGFGSRVYPVTPEGAERAKAELIEHERKK